MIKLRCGTLNATPLPTGCWCGGAAFRIHPNRSPRESFPGLLQADKALLRIAIRHRLRWSWIGQPNLRVRNAHKQLGDRRKARMDYEVIAFQKRGPMTQNGRANFDRNRLRKRRCSCRPERDVRSVDEDERSLLVTRRRAQSPVVLLRRSRRAED